MPPQTCCEGLQSVAPIVNTSELFDNGQRGIERTGRNLCSRGVQRNFQRTLGMLVDAAMRLTRRRGCRARCETEPTIAMSAALWAELADVCSSTLGLNKQDAWWSAI